jgi:hypothetical protein
MDEGPEWTTGVVGEPPGKTTLPKLRVILGLVAWVPPGKTTLPKLRETVCAGALPASSMVRMIPLARFME